MIINKDCLIAMKEMESESIDCILTDPPYGLKFMGKNWDCAVPSVEFWKEAHRISKKGTILAAFGGTRTFHRLTCAIEDAGWEIRDCIMWLYASGFPKGKTCLKPAWEPIILARKKGNNRPLNIDNCRIAGDSWGSRPAIKLTSKGCKGGAYGQKKWERKEGLNFDKGLGRWPANLILDEEAAQLLDEENGNSKKKVSRFFYCAKASPKERNEGLKGMPLKECQTGCSGNFPIDDDGNIRDRFKKTSQNHHPTIKPIALMEYLIKLIMPPQGILLDPFCGSGSTLVAAKKLGINAIGIELNSEYCEIAEKRVANVKFESE